MKFELLCKVNPDVCDAIIKKNKPRSITTVYRRFTPVLRKSIRSRNIRNISFRSYLRKTLCNYNLVYCGGEQPMMKHRQFLLNLQQQRYARPISKKRK